MSKKPYPGYSPNFAIIPKLGDWQRQCLVIELLSIEQLDNIQLAQIQEKLEATLASIQQHSPTLEKTEVVTPDRFDPVLKKGLRLP